MHERKRLFNYRLMPLILLGIVAAICVVSYFDASLMIASIIGAIIVLICLFSIRKLAKIKVKASIVLAVYILMVGITLVNYHTVEKRQVYSDNCIVEGRVNMRTESDTQGMIDSEYYQTIYLDDILINGEPIEGKAEVVFAQGGILEGIAVGDIIRFNASITPQNLNIDDSYSVSGYADGIYHYIYVSSDYENGDYIFEKVAEDKKLSDKIKLKVKEVLYASTRSDTAGFLYAMTFGDKAMLESDIQDAFSYTGTAHIFAVSGLHIGIIAGAILFILKRLKANNSILQFCIVGIVLIPFCALCEFSPSTVRATIMVMIMLVSKIIMLRSDIMTNWSMAAIILLIANPINLFDIGFLMSFMAVFGLITMSKQTAYWLRKIKVPRKLSYMLGATISTNMALLPIMLIYFGGQSLLLIIANLLILPVLGIIFPIYLLGLILASILSFLSIVLTIAASPFTIMIFVVKKISEWEFLTVDFDLGKAIIIVDIIFILAMSRYVFIPYKAKLITAKVLFVVFCIGVLANINIGKCMQAGLYFYTDSASAQYILVNGNDKGTYLVVNGSIGDDGVYATQQVLQEEYRSKIDGIVFVGEKQDSELVQKLMTMTNCWEIYSFSESDYSDLSYSVDMAHIEEGFAMSFLNRGTLEMVIGDVVVRVLADNYALKDSDFDILVTFDINYLASDNQYVVSEEGYTNSLQNYVPSTFTININNDKIKIPFMWRY